LAENSSASDSGTLTLQVDNYTQTLSPGEIENLVEEKSSLAYSPAYLSEIENINFCQYKKSIFCNLLFNTTDLYHIKKSVQKTVNEKKLNEFLSDLERKVNKDPENARLKFENEKVSTFSIGTDGVKLNKEKSFEIMKKTLEQIDLSKKLNWLLIKLNRKYQLIQLKIWA
jgi:vancomycin resistance protein YoaR